MDLTIPRLIADPGILDPALARAILACGLMSIIAWISVMLVFGRSGRGR